MFVLGHIGVTLGIAFVISGLVLPRIREGIRPKLNYLFIAFGAILPDLIDKPIGCILLGESVANGRLFGHTLLFVLILITIGYFLKDHRDAVFCLSFATFLHLCEDRMWEMPATLLYPLYGFGFPSYPAHSPYTQDSLSELFPFYITSAKISSFLVILVLSFSSISFITFSIPLSSSIRFR